MRRSANIIRPFQAAAPRPKPRGAGKGLVASSSRSRGPHMKDPTDSSSRRSRARGFRIFGWIAVASMLGIALLGPVAGGATAASNPGAIWTSLSTGAKVNANIYEHKTDVYLNGGPQNCGGGGGLPEGEYYFQVTDPSGATLLSSDAIKFRQVHVNANAVISGVSGAGNHATGTGTCNGALSVQLSPYDDSPNNGNEYSVDLASKAAVIDGCGDKYDENSDELNFV